MTFPYFNRRIHLYLGLALLPWFFMYGVSSIPFAHNQYFQGRDAATGVPLWKVRSEGPLDISIPEDNEQLREFGATVLRKVGIEDRAFGAHRSGPHQVTVYTFTCWKSSQIGCAAAENTFTVPDRRFRSDQFLTGMHARGGFEQEGVLNDSWSVVVDIVCVGMFLWIASGLYMWWGLRGHRGWGWLAIASGAASFAWFTVRL